MKKQIPLLITFVAGMVMLVQYFIPHRPFSEVYRLFNQWYLVVAVFAMILGIGNLIKIHSVRLRRRGSGWQYSIVLLCSLGVMGVAGLGWGIERGGFFDYLYWNMYYPLSSTMFALLAFFVASASYRAFRARTAEATLLLASAILVMLGRVPLGNYLWDRLPLLGDWIMSYPNMAGQRAIMIGIALGVVSTSLRIILGIERTYLAGR
ncbi:hypothetical protein AMJ40_06370 [candidate division TA06 bacterium DG_26]|uniref:Uncharacterized protein n=1 Tax=candidate division TA06 bacterium DG_26 TaxID=1703771 RepID=A0A0S7WHI1_UNCT6|nr:MAG: hypothetical protein AMJ40_06370 [candidate division TA06 bacterium DG_26]